MYFIMRHIRFEIFIDKMVPYALMFVILHMILNLFFLDIIHDYEDLLIFLEFFLITFVLGFDVVFKYRRSTSKKYFLKHHWLEIFAVFPFMLIFRLFEEAYLITRLAPVEAPVSSTQTVLHEVKGLSSGTRIVRDAELAGRASRVGMFSKVARIPAFIRGAIFFEHPLTKRNKKHHKLHFFFYSKHAKKALRRNR